MMRCRPRSTSRPRYCSMNSCCLRLRRLQEVLGARAAEYRDVVKTGRTHLMDAMPITLAQELERVAVANRRGANRAWRR